MVLTVQSTCSRPLRAGGFRGLPQGFYESVECRPGPRPGPDTPSRLPGGRKQGDWHGFLDARNQNAPAPVTGHGTAAPRARTPKAVPVPCPAPPRAALRRRRPAGFLTTPGSRLSCPIMGRVAVPDTVKRLVDRFDISRRVFLSGDQREEQLRAEFLNGPCQAVRRSDLASAAPAGQRGVWASLAPFFTLSAGTWTRPLTRFWPRIGESPSFARGIRTAV